MRVAVIKAFIDNVFLDNMKCNCIVYPVENGLSNHDAQILVLQELQIPFQKITQHITLDS